MVVVAYQGEPGSFSEEALWFRFAGADHDERPCQTFDEAAAIAAADPAARALLPIRNDAIGEIEAAVAAIEAHGLAQIDAFWRPIDHCLIVPPDVEMGDIRVAYSHPAALEQCKEFLAVNSIEARTADDTAGAVRELKERAAAGKADGEAAIASRRAAAIHGMSVLAYGIQDIRGNRTRFAVVRRLS